MGDYMQAIILAAGMGKRLGDKTKSNTKCMVKVNGKPLIDYTLNALLENDINNISIVVGHKKDNLIEYLNKRYPKLNINYIENPIYNKTNNIYSLWLAKDKLIEDDSLILESDLIFDKDIIKEIINCEYDSLAVLAPFERWMDGTVTIINKENTIENFISKNNFNWNIAESYYKTVNIYKFSKKFSEKVYMPFLEAYMKAIGKNQYYEQVLKVISNIGEFDLKGLVLSENKKWYEIDDMQDLDIAETIFAGNEEKLKKLQLRYGGYWRFPKLKDFCYLVNPYFPTKSMMEEMKYSFETLISEYPSGLSIQNLLAEKMFKCKNEYITIGNGAAELIKSLMDKLSGNFAITYPTFNEYPNRIGKERIYKFIPKNKEFKYTVDDIIQISDNVDNILLINPDNPTGNYISKEEMMRLLKFVEENNKRLIIDESFIDFAGENKVYTLIDNNILENNKNMYVIKSISKSYGVPGVRLGILATSDLDTLEKIKKELPIWNINSFGEYFTQIFSKYEKDYIKACNKISKERDRFYKELCKIDILRPIYSNANYFLCEVSKKYTSTELTKILLDKYSILIKDCKNKIGFEDKEYIRVAVRDYKDNNYIIDSMKELCR